MSVMLNWLAWRGGPEDRQERLVYLALANFAGDDGRNCYPSVTTLGAMTRLERRSIFRILARLAVGGWLTKVPGTHDGKTSQYTLSVLQLCRSVQAGGQRLSDAESAFVKGALAGDRVSSGDTVSLGLVTQGHGAGDFDDSLYRKNSHLTVRETEAAPPGDRALDFGDEYSQATGTQKPQLVKPVPAKAGRRSLGISAATLADPQLETLWEIYRDACTGEGTDPGDKQDALRAMRRVMLEEIAAGNLDPVKLWEARLQAFFAKRKRDRVKPNSFVPAAPQCSTFFGNRKGHYRRTHLWEGAEAPKAPRNLAEEERQRHSA